MNELEFKKFYEEIDQEKFKPFYFLYGDQDYLIERTYNYLIDALIPVDFRDFNFHVFYPEEIKADVIIDTYEMYPMMAPRRVMVFRDVNAFNESHVGLITSLIAKPNETVSVVFLGPFVDKKKKIFKLLNDKTNSLEFKKPYDNQIPFWIKYLATEMGIEIEPEAIHLLHQYLGGELRNISNELVKIKEYIHPQNKVTEKNVQDLVANSAQDNSFLMVEKWILGNEVERLQICEELVDSGESELGFLQLLARHLRILLQVKQGLEAKMSKDQLSKKNGIPVYFVDKYIKQSRLWSEDQILELLGKFSETEMAFKKNPNLKKALFMQLSPHQKS